MPVEVKLSTDVQRRIAELRATRPFDGRHVTLLETRDGWKYTGVSGICTRLATDNRHMVLLVEHDPDGHWPIGMTILAELGDDPDLGLTVPIFGDYS